MSADPKEAAYQFEFQKKLHETSDGMLAPMNRHDLRILSFASSHLNQAIRAVDHGCSATEDTEFVADDNKNVPKALVVNYCKSFAEPLQKGLLWTIVRREVEAKCPGFAWFMQDASQNHSMEQVQTQMQTLLKVHRMAESNKKKFQGDPKIELIKQDLKRTPETAEFADGIGDYVLNWSGGSDAKFLKDLKVFASSIRFRRRYQGAPGKCSPRSSTPKGQSSSRPSSKP